MYKILYRSRCSRCFIVGVPKRLSIIIIMFLKVMTCFLQYDFTLALQHRNRNLHDEIITLNIAKAVVRYYVTVMSAATCDASLHRQRAPYDRFCVPTVTRPSTGTDHVASGRPRRQRFRKRFLFSFFCFFYAAGGSDY